MTRDELVTLVRRIMTCDGSEEEIDLMLDRLKASVPHPRVTDLIFYASDPNVSAEAVVDEALSYEPLIIPPSKRRDV